MTLKGARKLLANGLPIIFGTMTVLWLLGSLPARPAQLPEDRPSPGLSVSQDRRVDLKWLHVQQARRRLRGEESARLVRVLRERLAKLAEAKTAPERVLRARISLRVLFAEVSLKVEQLKLWHIGEKIRLAEGHDGVILAADFAMLRGARKARQHMMVDELIKIHTKLAPHTDDTPVQKVFKARLSAIQEGLLPRPDP